MLKRLYINNYKSLVNFEISLDSLSLFLGENGTGKSCVLEVLEKIRLLSLIQEHVKNIFLPVNLTKWSKSKVQSFELDIEGNGGLYTYELEIEHDFEAFESRILKEKLTYNENPLFAFSDGFAQLYDDEHAEGPKYPSDWLKSPLGTLPSSHDNKKLTWFRQTLWNFFILRINPFAIEDVADNDDVNRALAWNGSNFASWYQIISHDQSQLIEIINELKEVLIDFSHFKFLKMGEKQSVLFVCFTTEDKKNDQYRLSELSDGQRILIVLYTLLCVIRSGDQTLLCIDEPFNHLGLPEIQPWLVALRECCEETTAQSILISHHPESIDYLASEVGYWFEREGQKPTRIKKIATDDVESGISFSELIARGWLYE